MRAGGRRQPREGSGCRANKTEQNVRPPSHQLSRAGARPRGVGTHAHDARAQGRVAASPAEPELETPRRRERASVGPCATGHCSATQGAVHHPAGRRSQRAAVTHPEVRHFPAGPRWPGPTAWAWGRATPCPGAPQRWPAGQADSGVLGPAVQSLPMATTGYRASVLETQLQTGPRGLPRPRQTAAHSTPPGSLSWCHQPH